MQKKQYLALMAALVVSVVGGVAAYSYFSGKAETKQNEFNLVAGEKNQNDAGTIMEPGWDGGGKAVAAAGLVPAQVVAKDPYIVSNADWSAWAIMKVEVPKFTEAPNAGKLTADLLNVNADNKWVLLKEEDSDNQKTYIYGYKEKLAGNNSTKAEDERARTSSLFDSFKIADDISLSEKYTGAIKVSGTLVQTEGNASVEDAVRTFMPIQPKDPELTITNPSGETTWDLPMGRSDTITVNYTGDGVLTYESSNTTAVTVSNDGVVEAVGRGDTIITVSASKTANYNAISKQISVHVSAPEFWPGQ